MLISVGIKFVEIIIKFLFDAVLQQEPRETSVINFPSTGGNTCILSFLDWALIAFQHKCTNSWWRWIYFLKQPLPEITSSCKHTMRTVSEEITKMRKQTSLKPSPTCKKWPKKPQGHFLKQRQILPGPKLPRIPQEENEWPCSLRSMDKMEYSIAIQILRSRVLATSWKCIHGIK